MTRCNVCRKEIRYDGQKRQWYHHLISDCPGAASGLADDNNHIQPATSPPSFTEHPLKLAAQSENNGDLFLLFDGELGQHIFHQRTDDAEQWAAFTECSVGSITAREIYEAARPHLDRIANAPTTTGFTEQARQLVSKWDAEVINAQTAIIIPTAFMRILIDRIASFAAEAATQGRVVGIERAAQKCDQLATELQSDVDAERPLGFIGAVAQQTQARECADEIRALSPDPSYLSRVGNEAATAALEQAARWQPVETAPKNGKVILGFCDPMLCSQGVVKAMYLPRKDIWVSPDGGEGYDLTHWMPLPQPPTINL